METFSALLAFCAGNSPVTGKGPVMWSFDVFFDLRLNQQVNNYNMTVWILAGNYISFTIAAGLIRLHMPGVKKSRV